jgi:hypothetical protein
MKTTGNYKDAHPLFLKAISHQVGKEKISTLALLMQLNAIGPLGLRHEWQETKNMK